MLYYEKVDGVGNLKLKKRDITDDGFVYLETVKPKRLKD